MVYIKLNEEISKYAMKVLSMYLKFPDGEPITAVDFRARQGHLLKELTSKHNGEKFLYAVEENNLWAQQMRESGDFVKVANSTYKSESRISKESFSLAIVDPIITRVMADELFGSVDMFVEPDFEAEERKRLEQTENLKKKNELDLSAINMTEKELEVEKKKFQKKLEKAIHNRRIAFRRAVREQEKRFALQRSDNLALKKITDLLMPGGVLVMITPKELIDTAITLRLANQYENIRILRLDEEEYLEKRKCIILATKRKGKVNDNRSEGYRLAETKFVPYKEIEEIEPQVEPSYIVPSQSGDAVDLFRVGPLTADEVADVLRKSNLIQTYKESYSQVLTQDEPVAPTPLNKGHIMLLLTSGYLNGYIGKGVNQHLVKGSAIKMVREETEKDNEGVETIKEREYYHISVKYLNSKGEFHQLM